LAWLHTRLGGVIEEKWICIECYDRLEYQFVEDFDIAMSQELEYDQGFQDGYRAGTEDSWGKGYDQGFSEGFRAGYAEASASHVLYAEAQWK